jgi:hypothetical protein
MRVAYGWLRERCSKYPKPLAVVLGLVITPLAVRPDRVELARPLAAAKPTVRAKPDPRAVRLQRFFARLHSPAAPLAAVFVREADEYHLDWRLLPSISVIESGGGKNCRNNNIFGWNGGNTVFPSIGSGIHEVAYRLGRSRLYKSRDVVGKLHLYNSEDEDYVGKVLEVMHRISPLPPLPRSEESVMRATELAYAE